MKKIEWIQPYLEVNGKSPFLEPSLKMYFGPESEIEEMLRETAIKEEDKDIHYGCNWPVSED